MTFDKAHAISVAITLGRAVEGLAHTVGPWPDDKHQFAVIDNNNLEVVAKADNAFDAARAFLDAERATENERRGNA